MMVKQAKKSSRPFSIATLACTANRPSNTPLFEAILQCNWTDIHDFLTSGTWKTDDYDDSTMLPREQAQEWTNYYDNYCHQKLRQLPLHTAITHLAPLRIVEALVAVYPQAVRLADSQGNLPLHISFMTNAKDVSSFLLKLFPEGLMECNEDGNLPIECYHHLFRTLTPAEQESLRDDVETRDQRELQELELQVARDEYRMVVAEKELNEVQMQLQTMKSQGQRMIRSLQALTLEEYRTGSVDL